MQLAVEEGYRPDNPAANIKRIKNRSDGFHTWDENEIAQFEARHPIGSKARLAFALLLYTAQRRSDVVRMGRQHIRGDVVNVRQQKTRAMLAIPLHSALAAIIESQAVTQKPQNGNQGADGTLNNLALLTTAYGKPFTAAGFGNWFRDRCNEAGLPEHCTAHWPAQGRLPAPCRGRVQCKRHRLHQRPHHAHRGRQIHQGGRPGTYGARGHGGHSANKDWQHRIARCQFGEKIMRFQRSEKWMAGATGLEPAASAVTGQRSNQLSYAPAGVATR